MTAHSLIRWARLLPVLFLAGMLVLPEFTRADDPEAPDAPVRLKRKKKPQDDAPPDKKDDKSKTKDDKSKDDKSKDKSKQDPKSKTGAGKDDPKTKRPGDEPESPEEPAEDANETIGRIAQNMRKVEDRLTKNDPGEATQGTQRDILKDLDKLIDRQNRQQQQQQQQGGGGSMSRQKRLQNKQAKGQDGGKKQPKKGSQASQKQPGGKGKQPKESTAKKDGAKKQGQDGKGGGESKKDSSKIADLYKDIWGHLPETLRQEMDTYSREQFMDQYRGLLKQYYSTLSEKGRAKGD